MLFAVWTAGVGASLWYNISLLQSHARDSARIQAVTAFEKDVLYRRWNSINGGVFVAVEDGRLAPNRYLPLEGREITDGRGKTYTKVNPAFMTRLVHEIGESRSGVRGHITSNRPIRPDNAPDPWETKALERLERGETTEVSDILTVNGKPYLRYISGLKTEESCLPCHAFQGYKVGDIRGGISIDVPMAPFYDAMRSSMKTLWLTHAALWLVVVIGLFLVMRHFIRRIEERSAAILRLSDHAQDLEERVAARTADLKASQQELRAFVDNVDAGVFLKETNGAFRFANARFAAMFNFEADAILGRANADIFPPFLAAAIDTIEMHVIADGRGAEYRHNKKGEAGDGYSFFIFPVLEEDIPVGVGGLVVEWTAAPAPSPA